MTASVLNREVREIGEEFYSLFTFYLSLFTSLHLGRRATLRRPVPQGFDHVDRVASMCHTLALFGGRTMGKNRSRKGVRP
jgi:hypothetical protein